MSLWFFSTKGKPWRQIKGITNKQKKGKKKKETNLLAAPWAKEDKQHCLYKEYDKLLLRIVYSPQMADSNWHLKNKKKLRKRHQKERTYERCLAG
jgi:hypothetical protein